MKNISSKKKIIFFCALILLTSFFVEAGAFTIYWIVKKSIFPLSDYQSDIWRIRNIDNVIGSKTKHPGNTDMRFGKAIEVIHPYLGFILDPKRNHNVSDFGFTFDVNPIMSRTNNKLIIGIFGGSFARDVYAHGRDILIRSLKNIGKEIFVVNLANGGYKQPQQLMILAYLLSLGAEFDIVINIDGFNEVALPPSENIPKNVFPIYPRAWYFRVAAASDRQTLMQMGQLVTLGQKRKNWAGVFTGTKLYRSVAACLIWKAVDRLLALKEHNIILDLSKDIKEANSYVVTGPQVSFPNDDALYEYLGAVWKRCSLQMQAICKGNNIIYYHFLQPNQYVEGSKPMKKEEREIAINKNHPYRRGIDKGYSILRRHGEDLIRLEVKYHDLTMTFAGIEEVLYGDDCCHLNTEGYRLISTTIGDIIKIDMGVQSTF